MAKLPENYQEKVYAGWLGKCIGVRFGAPIENWTYEQIEGHLGEIDSYLPIKPGKVFQPDDDTAVPTVLIRALEDYGLNAGPYQMGRTLLNYLGDQHGSLWWGGYGISTEHTAYLNMKNGIDAPASGSIEMNGKTVAEQIGGQIFSDLWGLIAPNDVFKAADYARAAASVTHDGNGIYGGMFIAAMVSAAFSTSNPQALIDAGLSVIPDESDYAVVVKAVRDYYIENPGNWRDCYQFIKKNFGYDRYGGIVHIIPNAGIIVMGILYGEGDFSRSIQITNMAGWDTDCNVGNVGAVMGVAVGINGIDLAWREPMNDMYVAASVIGSDNIQAIPAVVDRLVNLGRQLHGERAALPSARCHFNYSGSTHGFEHSGPQRNIIDLRQVELEGEGVLKGVVRLLKKKQDMYVFVNTYFHPDDLNSNYYGSGFSPTIYPGQTMRAKLFIPDESPELLLAGLMVYDSKTDQYIQGKSTSLQPGEWHELAWTIPSMENACLSKAGLVFRNMGTDTWKGVFYLDDLDWRGDPAFRTDFRRVENAYHAASQWTYLRGFWRVEDGEYHGSGVEDNETYTGDLSWQNVTLTADVRPVFGKTHLVNLRVQGALRSYAAGLSDEGLVLYKKENGDFRLVAHTPMAWDHHEQFKIHFSAKDNHLEVKVEGHEARLEWVDETDPYLNGMIGLSNFKNCHTAYEAVNVRPQ